MVDVRVRVAVAPVAVRQEGFHGRPTLVGLTGRDGTWPSAPLEDSGEVTARRLISDVLPVPAELLDDRHLAPQTVTFVESVGRGRVVTLLYTAALPMALAAPDAPEAPDAQWVELLHPAATAAEARKRGANLLCPQPHVLAVLDYWRQMLEETAGGLLFLAKYWTMPQLRDAYSAVWGYEQDAASFNKWADPRSRGGALDGAVEPLTEAPSQVTGEIATSLAAATAVVSAQDEAPGIVAKREMFAGGTSAGAMAGWTALAAALRPHRRVGLALASAGLVTGAVPAVALAAAAAGVAYQASTRGPAPLWYTGTTSQPLDHKLEKLYLPRPGWMYRGST